MRTLIVKRGHAKPLWHGHPWVHADSVAGTVDDGSTGPEDLVGVKDEEGRHLGYGLESAHSLLRVRLLTRAPDAPDLDALLGERLAAAQALRAQLFPDPAHTDAYRLVHSEGDGLRDWWWTATARCSWRSSPPRPWRGGGPRWPSGCWL